MKNVLVLCTGNSCRSQMAHGYLEHFAQKKASIYSAGIETHGVNPKAVAIMKLDNVDISKNTSNNVSEYLDIDFDFIITVCDHAYENCPYIPSKNAKRIHQNFFDPSKVIGSEEQVFNAFRKARAQLKDFCKNFIETELR
ncbi:arsenate reductase ArsC [Kordia algicida OT-1]|uniref:Arsenate reductase n=1 Tax=Kordia algicida OT-1 TaxID=391587 RepID=A9DNR2_9FLAO|nr:arsenate reductase ArsC [Kordia algicida]EDP97255.1 arsenate reductase [Kordia algicida OT-1]